MYIELVIILLVSLIFRILFWINNNTDDYVHYWNILQRQKLKSLTTSRVTNSVIDGNRGYPILHHYFLSLFDRKYWVFAGRLINLVYDLVVIFSFYFLVKFIFEDNLIYEFSYQFWATILLSTSPILFPVTARLQAMGARVLGFLIGYVYCLLLGYYFIFDTSIFLLLPMVFLGVLLIMTSQFGFQFFIFYSIIISFLEQDIVPFLALIVVFLIIFSIPKLGLRNILSFKLAHIKWYLKNIEGTGVENRNRFIDIIKLPIYIFSDKRKAFAILFFKNSYIISLLNIPIVVFIMYIYISQAYNTNEMDSFIISSIVSFLIMLFLTSHRPLSIFGEAERYLEYAAPLTSFYLVYLVIENIISFKFIMLFLFLNFILIIINFIAINITEIINNFKNTRTKPFNDLILFLKNQSNINILTIPIKFSFRLSTVLPQYKYYYRHINQKNTGFDYFAKDTTSLEFPIDDFHFFSEKYGINFIVIYNVYLDDFVNIGEFSVVYFNDDYTVLSLSNDKK